MGASSSGLAGGRAALQGFNHRSPEFRSRQGARGSPRIQPPTRINAKLTIAVVTPPPAAAGGPSSNVPLNHRSGARSLNPRGRETVLLLSHEPLLRRTTVDLLRQFGYEVLEAKTPVEAQELAGTGRKIDVLFTEYSMINADGLALVRWFQERRPEIKALVATDSVWELLQLAGSHERFAALAKPYSKLELSHMMKQLLG